MKTIARLVYEKTRYKLKDYCIVRGIPSHLGLASGYVSLTNARILEGDGIDWKSAKNARIAGGGCGKMKLLNRVNNKEAENE